ncbi:hypothetical protein B0O99DRAFT_664179 [Bisporella sp. PMI_857]|nr:hypothetical protein B0O99DRAFT_664179 [Bisporella sp. PMI_857]
MIRGAQAVRIRGFPQLANLAQTTLRSRPVLPTTRAFSHFTPNASLPKPKPKSTNFVLASERFQSTLLSRLRTSRLFHNSRPRRADNPSPNAGVGKAEPEPLTMGARMKKLGREYGWAGAGVYFALVVLDFPFCYLAVQLLGTDRIGEWEEKIISRIKSAVPDAVKQQWSDWRKAMRRAEIDLTGDDHVSDGVEMASWGIGEAEKNNKSEASLATQLAFAYAIHKSFMPIRIPVAVAITPRVVKILRSWGWDIGKRTTKEAKALKRAANKKPHEPSSAAPS